MEHVSKEDVREQLMIKGFGLVKVRYLGDKKMLLYGEEGVHMAEIINANKDSFCKMFEVIRP